MANQNKIQFGLKNVYYAKLTEIVNSVGTTVYSYGTPKAFPGAVSMSLSPSGDTVTEFADNVEWYTQNVNNGYEGDFEYETMPEDFATDILGETKDSKGVITEKSDKSTVYFALLFEIDGDQYNRRNVFYKCSATRETQENSTKGETVEPTHGTMTIKAVPRADAKVKAYTSKTVDSTTYAGWYNTVYTTTA